MCIRDSADSDSALLRDFPEEEKKRKKLAGMDSGINGLFFQKYRLSIRMKIITMGLTQEIGGAGGSKKRKALRDGCAVFPVGRKD